MWEFTLMWVKVTSENTTRQVIPEATEQKAQNLNIESAQIAWFCKPILKAKGMRWGKWTYLE